MTKAEAWRNLARVRELLVAGQAIPADLAQWLAEAIEVAVNVRGTDRERVLALGHELDLLARNRPKVRWTAKDAEVYRDFGGEFSSQNKAAQAIAEVGGFSKAKADQLLREANRAQLREIEELREELHKGDSAV